MLEQHFRGMVPVVELPSCRPSAGYAFSLCPCSQDNCSCVMLAGIWGHLYWSSLLSDDAEWLACKFADSSETGQTPMPFQEQHCLAACHNSLQPWRKFG